MSGHFEPGRGDKKASNQVQWVRCDDCWCGYEVIYLDDFVQYEEVEYNVSTLKLVAGVLDIGGDYAMIEKLAKHNLCFPVKRYTWNRHKKLVFDVIRNEKSKIIKQHRLLTLQNQANGKHIVVAKDFQWSHVRNAWQGHLTLFDMKNL